MFAKLLPVILLLTISSVSFSQEDPGPGTVTVFAEDGAKFTLYVNGAQANQIADSRVVYEMKEVPFTFRIVFQDSAIPEISKRGIRQGKHCLYAIVAGKKGHSLRVGGCTETPQADAAPVAGTIEPAASTSTPDQLSATYKDGVISINDGRKLKVTKVQANGPTYPRIMFNALQGSKVSLKYDNAKEDFEAESPMQYEVKDFQNNNGYVTVTVDEGGPAKTWHVKLQNANGFDLKIED
ncbi:MAG TPA: hypothetical protein VK508_12800 [Cyclobacteriaceae bacterium]|nr:hypothetical protein [Cyclobacteriaceae bacterium]